MEIKDTLIIAKEFGDTAGARDYEDGDFSGKEFYDKFLLPKFKKALEQNYILLIDLAGFWGWPSSFVSGSFGILSKQFTASTVLEHLQFRSESNPMKIEKVKFIIKNPDQL
tara:strand:+ start:1675 stop:2007 length:333 start_codon:yes stop_codon:yes gene_type:complete